MKKGTGIFGLVSVVVSIGVCLSVSFAQDNRLLTSKAAQQKGWMNSTSGVKYVSSASCCTDGEPRESLKMTSAISAAGSSIVSKRLSRQVCYCNKRITDGGFGKGRESMADESVVRHWIYRWEKPGFACESESLPWPYSVNE